MKKLKLNVSFKEKMLTKEQMRKVMGGQSGGGYGPPCFGQPCNPYLSCCPAELWCYNGSCIYPPGH
jgi:hypothetical protein